MLLKHAKLEKASFQVKKKQAKQTVEHFYFYYEYYIIGKHPFTTKKEIKIYNIVIKLKSSKKFTQNTSNFTSYGKCRGITFATNRGKIFQDCGLSETEMQYKNLFNLVEFAYG